MRIYCFIFLFICCTALEAAPAYEVEQLYVLNRSDHVFVAMQNQIRFSKRFRGRYYNEFPFEKFVFAEYVLQPGEDLFSLAGALGISVDSIATANGIQHIFETEAGQRLMIPNFEGIVYTAAAGISVDSLAARYHVPVSEIRRFNSISVRNLAKGEWIFLPGASMLPEEQAMFYGTAFASPLPEGVLSSGFGMRRHPITGRYTFHGGIDLAAPQGTPVLASYPGVVEFCGWAGGYGKLIIIRHNHGYRTFYGHLSTMDVRQGQQVQAGAHIGRVGSTGNSTGPHLHFEIRRFAQNIDPQRYTRLSHYHAPDIQ